MNNRDKALALASLGYRVFPLAAGSKRPLIKDFPNLATVDPAQVRDWWHDAARDIAISTGKGLLIVDPDVKDNKPGLDNWNMLADLHGAEQTFTLTTDSGGKHVYFKTDKPYGNGVNKVAKAIDHRGEGGFVKFYGDTMPPPISDLAPAPRFVTEKITTKKEKPPPDPNVELDRPDAIKRAQQWLTDQAPEAVEGAGGDDATYRVAARVKDFGVSEPIALDLMLGYWNETKAMPSWPPEQLAQKVSNAYAHGTNNPGSMSPEADFGLPPPGTEQANPTPPKRRLQLEWFKDVKPNLNQRALIKGVIDQHTMTVMYGQSNEGKTFVALDMALHIAQGWDWQGHRTSQGAVVYIAAEGGGGVKKRVEAFRRHYDLGNETVPFALIPTAVDLLDHTADLNDLVKLVREAATVTSLAPAMIVVDTLARAMGGGNENAPDDMGAFVRNVDALRARTGAAVLVVHHSGKDQAKGARGHSSLRAATDTELEVGNRMVRHAKQRDLEEGPPVLFGLKPVEVGSDVDGEAIVSCVLVGRQGDPDADFNSRVDGLPASAKEALSVLRDCIKEHGVSAPAWSGVPEGVVGVKSDTWKKSYENAQPEGVNKDTISKRFRRIKTQLTTAGLVDSEGEFLWVSG